MKIQEHTPNGIIEKEIIDEEYAKLITIEEKISYIARKLGLV